MLKEKEEKKYFLYIKKLPVPLTILYLKELIDIIKNLLILFNFIYNFY